MDQKGKKKSARKNHPESQFMFAFMLQAGEGLLPDPLRAYSWALLAELNGQQEADSIYNLSALALGEDEVTQARESARQCHQQRFPTCNLD